MTELLAIFLYMGVLFGYAKWKQKKEQTGADFLIGGRKLNRWTTALAAHASDMSNWLFMAYPGMIFVVGGQHIWVAIGLTLIMWANWVWIAPKLRVQSEKAQAITLCGFFESRFQGKWTSGGLIISCAQLIFYTVYVAAVLSGLALLLQTLFPIPYAVGVLIGIALVIPLLLIGGYTTLAQVDLFQGLFLLFVIIFVPLLAMGQVGGGVAPLIAAVHNQGRTFGLLGEPSFSSWSSHFFLMFGWGLGYFGQPHIITKFMGISNPEHLAFSRRVGMSWQFLSLSAATLVGFVGIALLPTIGEPELVFVELVRVYFPPFLSGIFLCAIIAAIINAMSSMLLVLSTTIAEDLYKRVSTKALSDQRQLALARIACLLAALCALGIALPNFASIDQLVFYAWSGLGATFGPLLIASLHFRKLTKLGASCGMALGALTVCFWPLVGTEVPVLIVAFPLCLAAIFLGSRVRLRAGERV